MPLFDPYRIIAAIASVVAEKKIVFLLKIALSFIRIPSVQSKSSFTSVCALLT
jgi:hypothetical protein